MQHPTHRSFAARAIGVALILPTLALAGCADLGFPTMPDYAAFAEASATCGGAATTERRTDQETQRARAAQPPGTPCAGGPTAAPPRR